MNVLIVSECSKKALATSRQILDQFAERKGQRTWLTSITWEGLRTLRLMLRKSAKRNTAIACHWIKSGGTSELLWIVGSLQAFNEQGSVATNSTARDVLRQQDENQWHSGEVIALLAAIAGLFHDFGKANQLFQAKLKQAAVKQEPLRHEWISLRMFQAFVGELDDRAWLTRLAQVHAGDEARMLQALEQIQDSAVRSPNPFAKLKGQLARMVGWLIVSHHRLPKFQPPQDQEDHASGPGLVDIDKWMTGKEFNAAWNSKQFRQAWSAKEWQAVWRFQHGSPILSAKWRTKAKSIAARALKHDKLFTHNWLDDAFTSHIARLCLMLADHCYSAGPSRSEWQDEKYAAYANTDQHGQLKQKLDEHNLAVGRQALLLAKSLPQLHHNLPAITRHKAFKQRSQDPRFRWQDRAYELAKNLRQQSHTQGFFGVNMASTGCGKTFANARIMYALADEKLGCRFSVALGLRTLTLQTGDALRQRLHLESDDLAVLVGSLAVRQLHELHQTEKAASLANSKLKPSSAPTLSAEQSGSESAADFFDETQYLRYDGELDDSLWGQALKTSPKLLQLLSAPVLISTIDHLMPATEGERGGKQIAPMLRLLTSDLVLDEPDDFDLADLPALCRLVNWAGMLGSRVVFSSATLPPALLQALFDAYASGRQVFQAARGNHTNNAICCAWFDEFDQQHGEFAELGAFSQAHQQFVSKRIEHLQAKSTPLRKAELLLVSPPSKAKTDVVAAMAASICQALPALHAAHGQLHAASGKRVSIGLIRIANIKHLVALAQLIVRQSPAANQRLHFCVYHSKHPLIVRSQMEYELDRVLSRHKEEQLWQVPSIRAALALPEPNQLFIVFASPVAEVGRDHDYDWAIAEPSSMRSLIQLAGRLQRHRQKVPSSANLLILNKNFKALCGDAVAYCWPGFESKDFKLANKDLQHSLSPSQYQEMRATPRIQAASKLDATGNLVDLEHAHLHAALFGSDKNKRYAALWWRHQAHWCAELQRKSRFRASAQEIEFVLLLEEEGDEALFHEINERGVPNNMEREKFKRINIIPAAGVQPWFDIKLENLLQTMATQEEMDLKILSLRYAQVMLRGIGQDRWNYAPDFGVYGALD